MKKNAFTLIELMAVIIILGIIALIAIPVVDKKLKESKNNIEDTQINNIKYAAKLWTSENPTKVPKSGKYCYLNYSYLVNEGLLDKDMIDPDTNEKYNDDNLQIKIEKLDTNEIKYSVNYGEPVNHENRFLCHDYVAEYDYVAGTSCSYSADVVDESIVKVIDTNGNNGNNIVGGSKKHIYKFIPIKEGSTTVTIGNNSCEFSYTYDVTINSNLSLSYTLNKAKNY